MRETLALIRASWHTHLSYRVSMLLSVVSLLVTVVPVYFVAKAVQTNTDIASSIAAQGGQYFAFLIVGMVTFAFVNTAVNNIPAAVSSAISSGTLEAMLATRASLGEILVGLVGYDFLLTVVKSALFVIAGVLLGMRIAGAEVLGSLLIFVLIILAYVPFGVFGAALVLAFRTTGPLPQAVLILSGLLGGVYYPMSAKIIPEWVRQSSDFVPLTYGLRALRQTLLAGAPFSDVTHDVLYLLGFVLVLTALSLFALIEAVYYARRMGTLAQY